MNPEEKLDKNVNNQEYCFCNLAISELVYLTTQIWHNLSDE